jgi:hypothetical protein
VSAVRATVRGHGVGQVGLLGEPGHCLACGGASCMSGQVEDPKSNCLRVPPRNCHPEVFEAIVRWSAIAGMARRITRGRPAQRRRRRTFRCS